MKKRGTRKLEVGTPGSARVSRAGERVSRSRTLKTPELNKMLAVKSSSQAIGEFLEWLLNEKHLELAQWGDDNRLWLFNYSVEKLLAEFFEIDLNKADDEKRALLKSLPKVA